MDTIKINLDRVKMIAHRGLSGIERENTCPAFVAAGNRSYFGIETDVHKTADGKFVIIHNETLKEVSLGKYDLNVELSDYREIEGIVLPDKDGSYARQDIRVPLLEEYVRICKKYEKKCVLELKNPFSEGDISKMIKEIDGLSYLDNMIFISFAFSNCLTLRKLLPEAKIQALSTNADNEYIEILIKNRFDMDILHTSVTVDVIKKMHDNGLEVNVWTCDDKEQALRLSEMGVDYITTNILE